MNLESNKIIGCVGIENYDVIIYLSKVLSSQNLRVLVVDYSNHDDLAVCIPSIPGIDVDTDFIECFSFLYTRQKFGCINQEDYDVIFVYYGFNINVDVCDSYILVTDMQIHNVNALKELVSEDKVLQLLVKDIDDSCVEVSKISKILNIADEMTYELPRNSSDIRNCSVLQYQDNVMPNPKKISSEIINFIFKIVPLINENSNEKSLKEIIKKWEKVKR